MVTVNELERIQTIFGISYAIIYGFGLIIAAIYSIYSQWNDNDDNNNNSLFKDIDTAVTTTDDVDKEEEQEEEKTKDNAIEVNQYVHNTLHPTNHKKMHVTDRSVEVEVEITNLKESVESLHSRKKVDCKFIQINLFNCNCPFNRCINRLFGIDAIYFLCY